MKILGSKFFGQDSAIFYLDTKKREIFALNSDRISRIKKDNFDVSPILDLYSNKFRKLDKLAYPFKNFKGFDALLETKGTSYFWLNEQRLIRKITKPKYRSDLLKKRDFVENLLLLLKTVTYPKIYYYKILRKYYWNLYLINQLPKNFHFKKIDQYIKETLSRYDIKVDNILYFDHHLCHAVTAYYFSRFAYKSKAIVFTLDEHGDECFSKTYIFDGNKHTEIAKSTTKKFFINNKAYVTSIAGLYSNFTEAMGLIRSTDEGKVEALAAYGKVDKKLYKRLTKIVQIKNLQFVINSDTYKKFTDIEYLITLRKHIGDKNFCATIQAWLNDVIVDYLNQVYKKYPVNNLCLAGGAVANIILNYNIYSRTPFKNIFIAPPMGDEGSAAGAAILSALESNEDISWLKYQSMPYFGPKYTRKEIYESLKKFDRLKVEYLGKNWYVKAAKSISENKVIAIFQGKMEFGPRALGNRSILANPANKRTRERINAVVKKRPWYQPFCPSVLETDRETLFISSFSHKHMATAFVMKKEFRDKYYSGIHIDGTARPQFVEKNDNPNLYALLRELKKLIGHGIVINTSYNLHGRTIVNSPIDAIIDFRDCNLDELYIEGYKVTKS